MVLNVAITFEKFAQKDPSIWNKLIDCEIKHKKFGNGLIDDIKIQDGEIIITVVFYNLFEVNKKKIFNESSFQNGEFIDIEIDHDLIPGFKNYLENLAKDTNNSLASSNQQKIVNQDKNNVTKIIKSNKSIEKKNSLQKAEEEKQLFIERYGINISIYDDWSKILRLNSTCYRNSDFHDIDTLYLRYYQPKNLPWPLKGLNEKHKKNDKKILDLKGCDENALNYFYEILNDVLADNIVISVVPSSSPTKKSGMKILADKLTAGTGRTNAASCLVRHTKVQKLTDGGCRKIDVHLKSITVKNKELIHDREVLLLDDVLTTGNSVKACSQLLREAGAKKVRCLVLGKTKR